MLLFKQNQLLCVFTAPISNYSSLLPTVWLANAFLATLIGLFMFTVIHGLL